MSTSRGSTFIRRASTSSPSSPQQHYEAVVVGAGAAGVTAVGNMLENKISPILWIDDTDFDGGRMNRYYREVPSNTKVKLFMDFGLGVSPFREIVSGTAESKPDAGSDKLQYMRTMDQEKGCQLSNAADLLLILTAGLKTHPSVTTQIAHVASAHLNTSSKTWSLQTSTSSSPISTSRLILATGSSPHDPPLPYEPPNLKHLDLDVALSPTKLSTLLTTPSTSAPTTVSVIGASHSAILVLWNLCTLALSNPTLPLRIKWFTRHPLRYAEYHPTFIARDNTGLKGDAATWAQQNLEPDTLPHSPVSRVLTKIAYSAGDEKAVFREHVPADSYVVQAIGYRRNALPTMTIEGVREPVEPVFDHERGVFWYQKNASERVVVPGLYGAGIAFPEKVVDKKYGHEEMNVGFGKFMKAVKKWVGDWKGVDEVLKATG